MKTEGHGREAKRAKILQALKAGNTRKAAYDYAGVGHDAFYRWLEEDRNFSESVSEAEATAEITCATTILNAARKGDWRAADTWLAKRRREDWRQVDRHELTGGDGGPVKSYVVVNMQDEV